MVSLSKNNKTYVLALFFLQSFALPPVKAKPEISEQFPQNEGEFGIPNVMTNGLSSSKSGLGSTHPLMHSELNVSNFFTFLLTSFYLKINFSTEKIRIT